MYYGIVGIVSFLAGAVVAARYLGTVRAIIRDELQKASRKV